MAAMARSGAWMYFVLFTLGALHCRLLCGYTTVAITVLLLLVIPMFSLSPLSPFRHQYTTAAIAD